ncbi:cytidine deaminase [Streptomyces sp. NPDC005322]|uniref:cytidine deaminase n=1 Tax=Streptomyces sp. NPDC005322 TaxID=3157032 RepID=UPI0033A800CA
MSITAPAPNQEAAVVEALVRRAQELIATHYRVERHQIGAVLLDHDGQYHEGVHMEAMVGRASSCAETAALANAVMASASDKLTYTVAVRHPKPSESDQTPRVVPPCGLCRELLLDYGPDIRVVLADDNCLHAVPLSELMPYKYVGTKWAHEQPTITQAMVQQ